MRIFYIFFLILILNGTAGISQIRSSNGKFIGEKEVYYKSKSEGIAHLLYLINDSVFKLTYFPKNWTSCWELRDYYGKYSITSDTITFIFDRTDKNGLSMTNEVYRIKSNGNIRKISGSQKLFTNYHYKERKFLGDDIENAP